MLRCLCWIALSCRTMRSARFTDRQRNAFKVTYNLRQHWTSAPPRQAVFLAPERSPWLRQQQQWVERCVRFFRSFSEGAQLLSCYISVPCSALGLRGLETFLFPGT